MPPRPLPRPRALPHHPRWAFNAAVASARTGAYGGSLRWLNRVADLGAAYPLQSDAFDVLRNRPEFAGLESRFDSIMGPIVRSRVAFDIGRRDLQPENVAYDPVEDVFYLGSIYRRKILRIRRDGTVTDFVLEGEHGLGGVLGMKLDPKARELWANACNLGADMPMRLRDPATVGRAGVYRFDIETGEPIDVYRAGGPDEGICRNDLTIAPDGSVYVSAGPDGVWLVDVESGSVGPLRTGSDLWISGIAIGPSAATLYLANGSRGVAVFDLSSAEVRVVGLPRDATLNWIDGLYVYENSLIGIQNGLRPKRVVQGVLNATGDSVVSLRVLESNHPLYAGPTTGAIVGDTLFYVATPQIGAFDDRGELLPREKLEDNLILALPIQRE